MWGCLTAEEDSTKGLGSFIGTGIEWWVKDSEFEKNLYLLKDGNIFKVVASFPPTEKDLWSESKEIWIYQKYLAKKTIRHSVTNHCSESFAISPKGYCSVRTGQWTWWEVKSILNHLSLGEDFVIVPGKTHPSLSASELEFDLTM